MPTDQGLPLITPIIDGERIVRRLSATEIITPLPNKISRETFVLGSKHGVLPWTLNRYVVGR